MTVTRSCLRCALRLTASSGALAAGLALLPGAAHAACLPVGPTQVVCSGTNTATQTVTTIPSVIVVTTPGFSVDTTTTGGDALVIEGDGSLAYNDANASSLTVAPVGGGGIGLRMIATGDFGGDPGSIFIDTAGTITGWNVGVATLNQGSGATNVTVADVSAARPGFGVGLGIRNEAGATDLRITANTVAGGFTGISAENLGTGDTAIIATGDVVGIAGIGISASNGANAGELTIRAATVSGGADGINALNNGTGATHIEAGDVTSANGAGIRAVNGATATDLTIAVDDVTATSTAGGNLGILAQNNGTGATTVTATGTVTSGVTGIFLINGAAAGGQTVEANNVTGGVSGIAVFNQGTGLTRITTTGDVVGTTLDGIFSFGDLNSAGFRADVNNVTGGQDGIEVINNSTASGFGTVITATGDIIGISGNGISVESNAFGLIAQVVIEAVNVSGGIDGIRVVNEGQGGFGPARTLINATGNVTGTTGDGIGVLNGATATDLTINAVNVTGASDGIEATNNGTGATQITVTGNVIATGFGTGIDAENGANTTGLTIDVNNVTGGGFGIFARHEGSGAARITASGTVNGGTGPGIDVSNGVNGTILAIDVADVVAGTDGIVAFNEGTGTTRVLASGDVTGTSGGGIAVTGGPDTTGITIDVDGSVTGGTFGIATEHNGQFVTSIRVGGDVIGNGDTGIRAANLGASTTSLSIIVEGDVSGATSGIDAFNEGLNTGIRIAGDVTGGTGAGIQAANGATATSLTIDVGGNVSGATTGISAANSGSAATDIVSGGNVTGGAGVGIGAFNADTTTSLTISANNVTGASAGIQAINFGTGVTEVTSTGTVVGTGGGAAGIFVVNDASATDIVVTAVDVSGRDGIFAQNLGTGETRITATGNVVGTGGNFGIFASNAASATNLDVNVANVSHDRLLAVSAANEGTGATRVSATGDVIGGFGGISARNGATGTDLTVEAVNVRGGTDGLVAQNEGTGATRIIAAGNVVGTAGDGIRVTNGGTATDLTLEAANVSGDTYGILARNFGIGETTVIATGTVSGAQGIAADNEGANTTDLTVGAASVIGIDYGIFAENSGTGATSVTATGDVIATAGFGIFAQNTAAATDLTVRAANVSGGNQGFVARNEGSGATSVIATGDATGTAGTGIVAFNAATATDLTVSAVNATGEDRGIAAFNNGTGATDVTATGNVAATLGDGILARNAATTTDLIVNAVDVTSDAGFGIFARNEGSGATSVTATGDVRGGFSGIEVRNTAIGTDLTVDVANVQGGSLDGIFAVNTGSGATSIVATGDVSGANTGLVAFSEANTTGLTIAMVNVTGAEGLFAINSGIGAQQVTTTGLVTGTVGNGIFVRNNATTTDLTVSAAAVIGNTTGIDATNEGTGATSIAATGNVTGTTVRGISVTNGATATDLTVTAADVSAGDIGIFARNEGTGATRVAASGDVDGAGYAGIFAQNFSFGTGLTIEAVNASGGTVGIDARGSSGAIAVTTSGNVTGGAVGISASASSGVTDVTINAANVSSGSGTGIFAFNGGTGNTSVTATGRVSSAAGAGISVNNAATDLTINAVDVTAGTIGISAFNQGDGATRVITTGDVAGASQAGITALNTASATDIIIQAADVTGGDTGINAVNGGTGATRVTATGTVAGIGDTGIFAENSASATVLAINAVNVTGGDFGILAANAGAGDTEITATGAVVSAAGTGIAVTQSGAAADLSVNAVDVTGGAVGIDTRNDGTDSTTIRTTGTVRGAIGVRAGNGATATALVVDALNVTGGATGIAVTNAGTGDTNITTRGLIQGGDNAIFAASSGGQAIAIFNTGTLRNASASPARLAITASGGPVTLVNQGTVSGVILFGDGADRFSNDSLWASNGVSNFGGGADILINGTGGTLSAATDRATAETTRYDGLEALNNAGLITLADGGSGDRLQTSGAASFAAGSVYRLDIGGAGAVDLIAAGGAVTLNAGRLEVNMAGMPVLGTRYTILTGASVTGRFDFADRMLTAFAGITDGYTPTSAFLEFAQMRALADAGLTPNQIATAGGADSLPADNPVRTALVLLPDDATARNAFDQLSGEVHPSARTALAEDSRLPRNAVLERLSDGAPGRALWGQAFGNWGDSDGDRNAAPVSRDTQGFLAGADVTVGDAATLGIAAGYLDTDLDVLARRSTGSARTIHLLGYAGVRFGGFNLRAGLGYAWADVDTTRSIVFPGFSDSARAAYDGSVLQGFAELGYRLPVAAGHVEPFASVAVIRARTDGFAETGGEAALSAARAAGTSTLATLGVRFETARAGAFSIGGRVGWQHGFGTLDPVTRLAFAGSEEFRIIGTAQSRNAAIANIEARLHLSPSTTLGLAYDGVLGSASQDHAFKARVRLSF